MAITVTKTNLKKWSIILSIVIAIVTASWGIGETIHNIDQRYLHKNTAHFILNKRYLQIHSFRRYTKNVRIRTLQDALFKLNFKVNSNTASALDKALKYRYEQELNRIK